MSRSSRRRAEHYAVLGVHTSAAGEPWLDAADVLLRTDDGDVVVFGVREEHYVLAHAGGTDPAWSNGYRPLPTTIDVGAVTHWDFTRRLWVGPADHSCLIWTNAVLNLGAIAGLFREPTDLLDGPDGLGLPSPSEVGLGPPTDVEWRSVGAGPVGGTSS